MTEKETGSLDTTGTRFGVFWLAPGITRCNALTLFFGGSSTVALLAFLNFFQPLLLTEVLHIPEDEQGSLVGLLTAIHETVVILLVGLFGALSDTTGRRIVFVAGLLGMAVGYAIYPLADTQSGLIAFRMVFAVGGAAAAVMMHTCYAEYSQNTTRGKWLGLVGICNGLGVVFMAVFMTKLPVWYGQFGFDSEQSVRYSFWTVAAFIVLIAVILRLGLQGPAVGNLQKKENFFKLAGKGLAVAGKNRRIALAYAMAFASRGDLVVLTVFFSLWVLQAGNALGMDPGATTARAGMLFGFSQAVALCWAFAMGVLLDRLNRMTAMSIAFGLAALGYLALSQVTDPFGSGILVACVLVGIGESSAMVASGVLIGQEAPHKLRGAVLGAFSVCGALGMVCLTYLGGQLFDSVGGTAPFMMMAIVNFIVLIGILAQRFARQQPSEIDLVRQETRDRS
jgi:MFS family permease